MVAPCKDCPDRRPHCHSSCEKYIAFQQQCKERREQEHLEFLSRSNEIDRHIRIKEWRRKRH